MLIHQEKLKGSTIRIEEPRAVHHLRDVLRVCAGERLECFDGRGRAAAGRVSTAKKDHFIMDIDARRCAQPPAVSVWLFQSIIRPERFEWILEKATELGAGHIVPVLSARCTRAREPSPQRLERWGRILESAAAQSGCLILPVLEKTELFDDALKHCVAGLTFFTTLAVEGSTMEQVFERPKIGSSVRLFIGPEGDFTSEEADRALKAGAQAVRLGVATLRAETAAIAALAILQHRLGCV